MVLLGYFFVCCEQASTSTFLNVGCDHAHGQDHWETREHGKPRNRRGQGKGDRDAMRPESVQRE